MKKPIVFGKYLLLDRVNVGGMAEVFIAKAIGPEGFQRYVAIKRILPTMAEDEEFIKMFIDEARISAQLSHSNIVHINELGKHEETYFIAMEYLAGRDLRSVLDKFRKSGRPMPVSQAAFIVANVCEGLDYAHRKCDARGQSLEIIHRDVSPQNVLISYEGAVKVIDFGIAKAANRSQKTQAGILKGKFGYMSPEQVRGQPIDRRTDIFAAGVMLFELLTNEKLFAGDSDYSILEKVRNAEIPSISALNPLVSRELEEVVLRALAREPSNRYQWASDLQEDLTRFFDADGEMFSAELLASYMKEAFAPEILKEADKLRQFSELDGNSLRARSSERSPRVSFPSESSRPSVLLPEEIALDVTDDSILPLDDADLSKTGISVPNRVVIGSAHPNAGATMVAPMRTDEAPPVDTANETRMLPAPEVVAPKPRIASQPLLNARRSQSSVSKGVRRGWGILLSMVLLLTVAGGLFFLIPRQAKGALFIQIEPAEAMVKVSGRVAQLQVFEPYAEGKYSILASAEGYEDHSQDVWIRSGEKQRIVIELKKLEEENASNLASDKPQAPPAAKVSFKFSVLPSQTTLTLNGSAIDWENPENAFEYSPGEVHLLRAEAPGYTAFESYLVAPEEGELLVMLQLERVRKTGKDRGLRRPARTGVEAAQTQGRLLCSTRPAGAEVWVNGRNTGRQTPIVLSNPLNLSVGTHKVVFKLEGRQSGPHVVQIREDEISKLRDIPLE